MSQPTRDLSTIRVGKGGKMFLEEGTAQSEAWTWQLCPGRGLSGQQASLLKIKTSQARSFPGSTLWCLFEESFLGSLAAPPRTPRGGFPSSSHMRTSCGGCRGKPSLSSRVLSPQVWDNGASGPEPGQRGAGPQTAGQEESESLAHQESLGLSLTRPL